MRRSISALIFAACVILYEKRADAHRIDEYLQATILSLESHRINASLRLIPGILVSPTVIAGVDADADGTFSESEERAYAQRVLDGVLKAITIDGKPVPPKLDSWTFPQPAQMREGLGGIHIEYAPGPVLRRQGSQFDRRKCNVRICGVRNGTSYIKELQTAIPVCLDQLHDASHRRPHPDFNFGRHARRAVSRDDATARFPPQ